VIPAPWSFALLALGAFRIWRLIGIDEITAPIRDRITGRRQYHSEPSLYREWLDKLLACPWCLGFYVAVAVWACWSVWPHWTLVVCAPFALSAVVGLVSKNLDA
jgi:hypothetical protein